ncbi:hypothetical protein Celly_0363 [Cellulophaga lytica DSM 7489]|uniref:Uncharacterized protein n=2 Tax=Cellulophaga lytica TaxID=979 RepID=F0RI72_CELLC|nr:hypothetical protein [Cellulophaga lytica]ADY28198.1 hypothetical protein Celly_0363 [Cellulophaga lytica DSM 7489]WQG77620.1 hypothetical protein SR888_01555 [Cellulophaga lytica]
MRKTFTYLALVILLIIIGFLLHKSFFEFSIALTTEYNIKMITTKMSYQFISQISFALVIGILPLLYLCVEKLTKIKFLNQGLITCGIILLSGILFWQLRIYLVGAELKKMANYNSGNEMDISYNIQNVKYNLFLLLGFGVGAVISIFIYRNRNKIHNE